MTETTGPDAHLDTDTLADLDEGLLTASDAAAARVHLDRCSRCGAELAALTAVRVTLAGAADVGPVPADVAARLDQALAAVAAEPASTATTPTVTPLRSPAAASPRGIRWLQAAAVVVLLLAGGALGLSALLDAGGSSDNATTSSGDAGSAAAPKAADSAGFPLTASGRDWTQESVKAATPQLLAGSLSPTLAPASPQASGGDTGGSTREFADAPAARLAAGPALADCVTELAGGPVTPLAVDLARYAGKPAAVVLLPGIGGAGTVDVWVVGPDCAQGKDELLYYASVPVH
jgi:anti-sigma factor RsiW